MYFRKKIEININQTHAHKQTVKEMLEEENTGLVN